MPSTSYNVTMIKAAVNNYSRQQILDVLNEICLIAYSDNTMLVEKIDPLTGLPPLFPTTDNVFLYNCPADCREVAAILVKQAHSYSPVQGGIYSDYVWRNDRYFKVMVKQTSATKGVLSTVTFVANPGTTTDKYYILYFQKYVSLGSELVELPFPEEVHYILRTGVIQMLRGEAYEAGMGNIDPIQRIVGMIKNKLNKGSQIRTYRTPVPIEYMDDDFGEHVNY